MRYPQWSTKTILIQKKLKNKTVKDGLIMNLHYPLKPFYHKLLHYIQDYISIAKTMLLMSSEKHDYYHVK